MLKKTIHIIVSILILCSCNSIDKKLSEDISTQNNSIWIRSEFDQTILNSGRIEIDTISTSVVLPENLTWLGSSSMNHENILHTALISCFLGHGPYLESLIHSSIDTAISYGKEKNYIQWSFNKNDKNLCRTVMKNKDTISFSRYLLDSIYFDTINTPSSVVILRGKEKLFNIWGNSNIDLTDNQKKHIDSLKGEYNEIEIKYFDFALKKYCKGIRIGKWMHQTLNYDSIRSIEWKNNRIISDKTIKVANTI